MTTTSCDGVREQLAEHLLGTLEGPADLGIRRHLRGCSGCRLEMTALGEGVNTFARAAHEIAPPEELRERVLTVLEEEWSEPASHAASPRAARKRLAVAASVAVLFAGTLAWAVVADRRAHRYEVAAERYGSFLDVLGGENVRVGPLRPVGGHAVEGSVVLYDAKPGEQSWVLVLVRAPGVHGSGDANLWYARGPTITLPPVGYEDGGEASTWFVTTSSLKRFDRLTLIGPDGTNLAIADIS